VVTDGIERNIPIFESVHEALSQIEATPTTCVIGVATYGGRFTQTLLKDIRSALESGLNVVNGLHDHLCDDPQLLALAQRNDVNLIDLRKPKKASQLHAWEGTIYQVNTPRIAILGTDCAIGKRTTSSMLYQLCNEDGIKTQMIYTGQTSWMQGFKYGFILDSTLNDFVSGELEHAVVSCDKETNPDLILFEGQSALRNPSGPCGAEFICSGGARGVILQHVPGRKWFNPGNDKSPLPSLQSEIELIKLFGAKVLAVSLNTSELSDMTWQQAKLQISQSLQIPTICPREEGLSELLPIIKQFISNEKERHNEN